MSLHETPMFLRYWDHVGGTLAEEFAAVRGSATASPRRLDGVIVPGGERRRVAPTALDVAGKDIIGVQAKANRLGMYLMGQALFSRELMKPFRPASIRTVALCAKDDSVLRLVAEEYGIEVVVDEPGNGSVSARLVARRNSWGIWSVGLGSRGTVCPVPAAMRCVVRGAGVGDAILAWCTRATRRFRTRT